MGPEDLLFDYLESAVATHHQRDWARALAIAEVLGGDLDLGYLYGKAHDRREGAFVDDLDRLLAAELLPARDRDLIAWDLEMAGTPRASAGDRCLRWCRRYDRVASSGATGS